MNDICFVSLNIYLFGMMTRACFVLFACFPGEFQLARLNFAYMNVMDNTFACKFVYKFSAMCASNAQSNTHSSLKFNKTT